MRFKTGFLIGVGAGYVLGAKAGRERYDQIVEATRSFLANPGVQRLTDEVNKTVNIGKERVSTAASRRVEQVSGTLAEQASKARSFVASGSDSGDSGDSVEKQASGSGSSASRKKSEDTSTSGAPPATTTSSTRGSRSG